MSPHPFVPLLHNMGPTTPLGPPRQDVTWFPLSERHEAAAETAPHHSQGLWEALGAAPVSGMLGDTAGPWGTPFMGHHGLGHAGSSAQKTYFLVIPREKQELRQLLTWRARASWRDGTWRQCTAPSHP